MLISCFVKIINAEIKLNYKPVFYSPIAEKSTEPDIPFSSH